LSWACSAAALGRDLPTTLSRRGASRHRSRRLVVNQRDTAILAVFFMGPKPLARYHHSPARPKARLSRLLPTIGPMMFHQPPQPLADRRFRGCAIDRQQQLLGRHAARERCRFPLVDWWGHDRRLPFVAK